MCVCRVLEGGREWGEIGIRGMLGAEGRGVTEKRILVSETS